MLQAEPKRLPFGLADSRVTIASCKAPKSGVPKLARYARQGVAIASSSVTEAQAGVAINTAVRTRARRMGRVRANYPDFVGVVTTLPRSTLAGNQVVREVLHRLPFRVGRPGRVPALARSSFASAFFWLWLSLRRWSVCLQAS